MTDLFMLDTDTVSYLIKEASPGIESRLAEVPTSHVCISVITRAKLLFGLQRLSLRHALRREIDAFFDITQTLPWPVEAADRYADIRYQLMVSGQPIVERDMMIAAHALAVDATLVTNDQRHFARIDAPLMLANWHDD